MARTISTAFAISGETEYKKAIADINRELKTLKSSLNLTENEFRENANSMDALKAKGSALERVYEAQQKKVTELGNALENAQRAQSEHTSRVEVAKTKIAELEKELSTLKNTEGDTSTAQERVTQELEKWNKELVNAQQCQEAANRGVQNMQQRYNAAKIELNNLSDAVDDNNRRIEEEAAAAEQGAGALGNLGENARESGESISALGAAMLAAGIQHTAQEITGALRECIDASVEFESAVTGVYKTIDGTPAQLQEISDEIKKLSTEIPATTTEIAGIAEVAGQLGIETPKVMEFTRVMLALGYSTDVSAEEAATSLAQLANIVGTSSDDYERLGSTVVALGNNFATQESKIIAMSQRLAASGKLAGLTEAEIMALATAMSSVGIEAEAGGTAMSQTMTQIEQAVARGGESLEQFAKIAGVSSQEFADLWNNNAIDAIQLFVSGLGELEAQGESATLVLDEMGLTGIRQSNMLKSLALASGELDDAIMTANIAWEQNTALAEEAGKRYATTESALAMCNNAAGNLKIAIGDVLSPALKDLADTGTDAFVWAAEFIEENPWVVSAITAVATATTTLAVGFGGLAIVAEKVIPLLSTLNGVLLAHPYAAAAAAAISLAAGIGTLIATSYDANDSAQVLTRSIRDSGDAYRDAKAAIDENYASASTLVKTLLELSEVENKSATQKQMMLTMVQQLNEAVPGLALSYDETSDALNMTGEALERMLDIAKGQEDYQENVKRLTELENEQAEIAEELEKAEQALAEARDYGNGSIEDAIDRLETLREAQEKNGEELDMLAVKNNILEKALGAVADKNTELQDAYQSTYESAYESVTGQQALFGGLSENVEITVADINQALIDQATALDDYATNMQTAIDRGVNEGLVQTLSDGSARSMAIMAALAGATKEEIAQINQSYASVQTGADAYIGQIASMETGTKTKMDSISGKINEKITAANNDFDNTKTGVLKAAAHLGVMQRRFDSGMGEIEDRVSTAAGNLNIYYDASVSGASSILGYINGAESMRVALIAEFTSLAQAANAAYNAALDQHSPSRLFYRNAKDTIRGAILGSESMRGELELTYTGLAEAAISAYQRSTPRSFSLTSLEELQRRQTNVLVKALSGAKTGDTVVNIVAPKAMDERTAAREFKRAMRDISLGVR